MINKYLLCIFLYQLLQIMISFKFAYFNNYTNNQLIILFTNLSAIFPLSSDIHIANVCHFICGYTDNVNQYILILEYLDGCVCVVMINK